MESVEFDYRGCHPGYVLDISSCQCKCDTTREEIIRCDDEGRYIYLRVSLFALVGITKEASF